MALLVASLLLAALAPVMTKRMDEAKINISGVGAAQYDKDSIIPIFTGAPDEDKVFNVPSDVNMIKVTMIGGGGAGGSAFYGKQEVTTSKSWTVPEGVKKLRIFMVGGGGGGASGGLGTGTAYGKTPAFKLTKQSYSKTTPGEEELKLDIPSNYVAPVLDEACKASGTTEWTIVQDNSTIKPGEKFTKIVTNGNTSYGIKFTNLYACGGGGGGGGYGSGATGGGGGSGGYIANQTVVTDTPISQIKIIVGGGGGGGSSFTSGTGASPGWSGGGGGAGGIMPFGTAVGYGGTGGMSSMYEAKYVNGGSVSGYGLPAWSGIGGKPGGMPETSIKSHKAGGDGAFGAGNGGTGAERCDTSNGGRIAGGGGGGGLWGGGGGGGGSCNASGGGGGGGGAATGIADGSGNVIVQAPGGGGGGSRTSGCCSQYAGGGGGGGGGNGGGNGGPGCPSAGDSYMFGRAGTDGKDGSGTSGGTISSTFGSSYCNGGDAGTNSNTGGSAGKPGAIKFDVSADIPEISNALKCAYSLPANGSGGGGAGQIVVGEIDVTPGETLYFEIGAGGAVQANAGKNGNAGYSTKIRRGGASGTVIAEALGGLAGQYSSAETTPSYGGGERPTVTIGNNWTGVDYRANSEGGENGNLASALINKGYGGKGGSSQNIKGETLQGGAGGNSVKNGMSPLGNSYGAGGGGGAGSPVIGDTTFGIGAAGAAGYIYLEYGGTNGGGGTTGEFITKTITNLKAGVEIKLDVGKGGDNAGDGAGKATSIEYTAGSTVKKLTARGGIRGNDGTMTKGVHAPVKSLPNTYANYKTDENATANGHAATETYGGIGGYIEELYQNPDGSWATYIKAKDGTVAGPVLGGCGGNLTTLMSGITCNDAANTPNGKNGVFGGGGGGGAVINDTGGIGGKGGDGVIILEYKSTSI